MSALHLKIKNVTPPDKFRFVHPEDGHKTTAFDYDTWIRDIRKHRKDNGYPIPDNLTEIVEDQFCRLLDGEWCAYVDGRERGPHMDRRIKLSDVMAGTRVLLEFAVQGKPLVDRSVAEARALTCSRCYALDTLSGCGGCAGFGDLVAGIVGAKSTPHDSAIEGKVCMVCKCSAKANVWVPVEVSKVGVSEEALALFEQIPHCWKREELLALTKITSTG